MKSVYISKFGGPSSLEIRDVPNPPAPEHEQLLISVRAAALNRADLLQRKGLYPAPKGYPERIPGLEFAGEVVSTGPECEKFKIGDRVMGITAGGAQAEQILVDEEHCIPIPDRLDYNAAAAVPEAFVTAHDAVWTQGELGSHETLLIHAVGSGVGLAALQIAKASGNKVVGTSRTQSKLDRCLKAGLDIAINTSGGQFADEVVAQGGADVVLDLVGAGFLNENLKSLNNLGRLIVVGLVGGRKAEFDLGMALTKRIKIIGTLLRSRTVEEKASAVRAFEKDVLPLIAEGTIEPFVDRIYPIGQVAAAHSYLESNASFGKVVLEVG
ncbi:MAG: NAD(P)H-quinone oxidoreductase [Acidobacteriota bacterium]|nr:NAD(P)H-quinone oxidoreductase [Acidobacteriota bacterium]